LENISFSIIVIALLKKKKSLSLQLLGNGLAELRDFVSRKRNREERKKMEIYK
jgi:hypothetical protein